jgi:plasmid stabilization system protein ParE
VDETVARIVKNPRVFPVVLNDIRRAIVKRFPYAIYYEIRENELLVLAIFHSKRDPQQWRLRI